MKLANHHGRLALVVDAGVVDGGIVDVHDASGGRFGPDPAAAYDDWDALRDWAAGAGAGAGGEVTALDEAALGAPSPAPRQVFAIGLNYASHAAESGMDCRRCPPSSPSTRPRSAARSPRSSCGELGRGHRHDPQRGRGPVSHPRPPA